MTAQNSTAGQIAYPGIGLDSTTASAANSTMLTITSHIINSNDNGVAAWRGFPGVGRHTLVWLESNDAGGTWTYVGDAGAPTLRQTGIFGSLMC